MEQSTFDLLINKIIDCEKKSVILSHKNKELNAIKQSYESKMNVMKNTINLLEIQLKDRIKQIKQQDND